ncbi:chemotaxis protein CheW [Rhodoferax saidenbachensis]|uniref:chemotaxis protein CheW n=1 Tax=Rhodoferax saidenbachensis TaxID=1484693 RepID=UPI0004A24F6B
MNPLSTSGVTATPAAGTDGSPLSKSEFLAFKLGEEEYCIDILRVQEIRSYDPPTRMANAQPFIKGVINLRGVIVPIIDMRLMFSMEHVVYDGFTVVIVLNVGEHVMGIVVDGVSDVITFEPDNLHPAPQFASAISTEHVLAIGSLDDRTLILLDIEKLLISSTTAVPAEVLQ